MRALAAPRRYSVGQRLLFVLALVLFAVASAYAGLGLLTRAYPAIFPGENAPLSKVLASLGPLEVKQPDTTSRFNRRQNFLILGLDQRPYESDTTPKRADTIMVATIDPVTKEASILGFPRDMLIRLNLPDGSAYDTRINESYLRGVEAGGTVKAGAEQLKADLKWNFGITIDHWVVMNFTGVEELIDSIGGVDVDIPEELATYDWWYSDEGERPPAWIRFDPGPQHLSGYRAVAFGRYRNDSDLKRVKRQQLVLMAALEQVFSLNLLTNPYGLYNSYKNTVQHDVAGGEMPGLANLLLQARGRIQTYSLGDPVNGVDTMTPYETAGGAAVLVYNQDNVTYWLNQVFTKASYSQSNVEIQNGYGAEGDERAAQLGRYLKYARGLPTVYLGPEQPVQAKTAIKLYRKDRRGMAEDIANWMDIPVTEIEYVEEVTDAALPDIVIVIGQDFVLPGG
jgi:LCP family protein required for cell wall assembly